MTKAIETIREPREMLLTLLKDLSTEQLNKIPEGFNNNIIWNLGHMIASQQGDWESKVFISYTPFTTRYGVELGNIEEAIHFIPFHEGLHIGAIMTLKRLVA